MAARKYKAQQGRRRQNMQRRRKICGGGCAKYARAMAAMGVGRNVVVGEVDVQRKICDAQTENMPRTGGDEGGGKYAEDGVATENVRRRCGGKYAAARAQ